MPEQSGWADFFKSIGWLAVGIGAVLLWKSLTTDDHDHSTNLGIYGIIAIAYGLPIIFFSFFDKLYY